MSRYNLLLRRLAKNDSLLRTRDATPAGAATKFPIGSAFHNHPYATLQAVDIAEDPVLPLGCGWLQHDILCSIARLL